MCSSKLVAKFLEFPVASTYSFSETKMDVGDLLIIYGTTNLTFEETSSVFKLNCAGHRKFVEVNSEFYFNRFFNTSEFRL